jgi:SAM-dependent methyltransferase
MPMAETHELPPLELIASRTLAHYESNAAGFWQGTRDHDVTQNYAALLDALGGSARLRILDFGCGPGRDLIALRDAGHAPVGLDGCASFVAMARARSGCEVLHQSFFELALADQSFDGVFANASLFHVPRAVLPRVLRELFAALVRGGVLFCSNPRSFDIDTEGWQGQRYGSYLTIESWVRVIAAAGFVLERQFLRPDGKPTSQQPWLAMVWRKPLA